jgi:two-component system sensor histidine kinase YesM
MKPKKLGIFQKFTLLSIGLCIVPMLLVVLGLYSVMEKTFDGVMRANYLQTVASLQDRFDVAFESYDHYSSLPYYYYTFKASDTVSYLPPDEFRQLFQGETSGNTDRKNAIEAFLRNILWFDSSIKGVQFLGYDQNGEKLAFHVDMNHSQVPDSDTIFSFVDWEAFDHGSKSVMLFPPHDAGYFTMNAATVFTVGRNYFDLRGDVDSFDYVGTLFVDVDISKIATLVNSVELGNGEKIFFMVDGSCWYSNDGQYIGKEFSVEDLAGEKDMVFFSENEKYGIETCILVNSDDLFFSVSVLSKVAVFLLLASILLFSVSMLLLLRRFSKPLDNMMAQMERLEQGEFDVELPIESDDEIGELAKRFVQMSRALDTYIDKVYVSQLRQTEAELTALKSQIYPHFLYNTLEVIRMTALESSDSRAADMIESLSEQIHYVIGPVRDFVPVRTEIGFIEKYVHLLNCKIATSIKLEVHDGCPDLKVPKLLLQPVVENAYIHGIKPMGKNGTIEIDVSAEGETATITIMNTGLGMDKEQYGKMMECLKGDEPGIRNEINWQSVGLKNVYDRIQLLYKGRCGFKVESQVKLGTIVTISIPAEPYEEERDDQADNRR